MKRTILIGLAFFWGYNLIAQQGDTTKIKLGDTKIIIIDNEKNKKTKEEKKEQALKEFESLLKEKEKAIKEQDSTIEKLNKEMEVHKKNIEAQQNEQIKKEEEQKIKELNDQVAEMNKKVEELNKEISALEKGIEGIKKGGDEDFDVKIDKDEEKEWKNKKFDWDFDNNWPHDWDHMSPFGRKDKFRGHWAGFELGLNNYMNADKQFTFDGTTQGFELNAGRSWIFTVNFLQINLPFGKYAGMVTGLGTTWNNYSFRNNVDFHKDASGVMVASPDSIRSYDKNAFHTWNFTFPLILEFQIPSDGKNSGIYLGVGAYGIATVSSWGKVKYQLDDVKYEEKRKSDFQINNLRYGLTARLGLKYLRFFVNYDLVSLFQKDRGPELYPVSAGLTLISF